MKNLRGFLTEVRSREEADEMRQKKDNPDDWYLNNKGGGHWHPVTKEKRKGQSTRRKERLKPGNLASKEDAAKGKRKENEIHKKGMEVHHITPTDESQKIKGNMSDAEWEKKKESDAEGHGRYHGHHPRNLAATTGPKTPKGRKGIPHRAGGYHEAEGEERKSKDSGPVVGNSRDIIATRNRAASKARKRKELGR